MRQLLKSFFHLLPRFFSEKNFLIFPSYVKLYLASFIHHRFNKDKKKQEKKIRLLGYNISFFNYPVLINQFEEIFIYKSYRFKSSTKSPLIFDCGSNIGISILYFKKFHPDCHIVAFEPDPNNFSLLRKNVPHGFTNIILHNYALGMQEGICKLFNTKSQNSSIYSIKTDADFVEVPMKKLSDFIQGAVDFMKIDVEGAEGEIIKELNESGKLEDIKELVMEFHPISVLLEDDIILVLKNKGFESGPTIHQEGYQEKIFRFKKNKARS